MSTEEHPLLERASLLVPLNKLPGQRQTRVLEQSDVLDLRKKAVLFEQGDRDDFTFYLLEGELELYSDGSLIKRVLGGDGASFQPLAQLQPRQMSAIAKSKSQVLRLKRSLLEQLLSVDEEPAEEAAEAGGMEVDEIEFEESGDWLMKVLQSDLFTRIPPSNIQGLLDTLESTTFTSGQDVIRQGEPGDYYYIVQSGTCEVLRAGSQGKEIRLAQLGPGDTFGEEALISDAERNATVRMASDGELARLTKSDFEHLIKQPLLHAVERAEADELVADGARWLDVRFEDEHQHNGLADSINIPLGMLRKRATELDPETRYVAYCDTGGRSSAAAFLLAERGLLACYVTDGAVADERTVEASPRPQATAAQPSPTESTSAAENDEAGQQAAAALHAEAEALMERARAAMAEAEAMKRAAAAEMKAAEDARQKALAMKAEIERVVAEQVARQRGELESRLDEAVKLREQLEEEHQNAASLKTEAEALKAGAEQIVAEQTAEQRDELENRLDETQRLQDQLSKQRADIEAAARKRQEELEAHAVELEERARKRLANEKERLDALYREQTAQLESTQADRESQLREELERQLSDERKKFSREFLRANEELEKAREEREAALAAKDAAKAEAETIIAKFKEQQQRLIEEHRASFESERANLKQESERIEKLREEVTRARAEAEAARAEAQRELEAARTAEPADQPVVDSTSLDVIEQRANKADEDLRQAIKVESAVAEAARDNESEAERSASAADEISLLLQKELTEWVDEQERVQESTLQREVLSRQKAMVDRIRNRAAAAKVEREQRARTLLDEIEEQLRDD